MIRIQYFHTLLSLIALLWLPLSLDAGLLNPFSWFSGDSKSQVVNDYSRDNQSATKRLAKAEHYQAQGKEVRAQKIYKRIVKKYPKTKAAAVAALKRGTFLQNKGRYTEAFETYAIVIQYHPDSSDLEAVIQAQYTCAVNQMQTRTSSLLGMLASDRLNTEAIPLFQDFSNFYPYHKKTPQAYMQIAKIARDNNQQDVAIEALKKIINDFSGQPITEEAYFAMAHIYSEFVKGPEYDLESTREAIRYCEDFIALFPKSTDLGTIAALYERMVNTLAQNRLHLADYYYFNKRNTVAALIFYNEVIDIAPNSEASSEALKRIDSINKGLQPTTGTNFFKRLLFIQ